MRALVVAAFVGVVLFGAAAEGAAQCAMCRTALESSDEGRQMAAKFNEGIVFLLGAPFGVAVGIGLALRRSRRRLSSL